MRKKYAHDDGSIEKQKTIKRISDKRQQIPISNLQPQKMRVQNI